MFKHILVPTDGSELSTQAVAKAVAFAAEARARLTFICARAAHQGYFIGAGALRQRMEEGEFDRLGAEIAGGILGEAGRLAEAAGVPHALLSVPCDSPSEAIVKAAEEIGCDVIFMASHGRRGISGLLLGSETVKVLTHSRIPVLVYR